LLIGNFTDSRNCEEIVS